MKSIREKQKHCIDLRPPNLVACCKIVSLLRLATLLLGWGTVSSLSFSDEPDWSEFRGANGDGSAGRANVPIYWGGPFRPPTWSTHIQGQGWSSPIVIGDSIWLSSAELIAISEGAAQLKLDANEYGATDFQTHGGVRLLSIKVNALDGKIERSVELEMIEQPSPIHSMNSYASPTPCTDGESIVFHFGALGTYCVSLNGDVRWKLKFNSIDITGPATSPTMRNGLVYFAVDGTDDQYTCAIRVADGKEVWRTQRPPIDTSRDAERRSFSTPLLIEFQNQLQLLSPCAQWLVSYNPNDGSENWRCRIGAGHALVPRAVYQDGVAFVCSGYMKPELFAIKVDGQGDVSNSHVLWNWKRQVSEIASPILIDDSISFISDSGVVTCLSQKTGEQRWQHRLPGSYSSSPTSSKDLAFFTNQAGVTTVVRIGATMDRIATNELFGETFASFAVHKDAFVIRSHPLLHYIQKSEIDTVIRDGPTAQD